ncbi:MAG: TrkH family potassium uptake protein, partial [Salinibacterium sp.]|nr:TrkH family potassium uptake protein [Salinibacterium sp.]
STHTASVGHYSAASVRIVVTLFMFLAGVNFTLYFRLWHGRPRDFLRDPEFRLYAGITAGAILLIAFDLHRADLHESAGGSLRASAFQVVSVATTTGFATEDFDRWPDFSRMLLVVLMFIGGSAGSTAGGMKVIRVALAVKFLLRQLRLHVKPRSVEGFRIGQRNITPETLVPVICMVGLFVATFVLGALVLAATGLDLVTAATASIATLGNIGPGLAGVGPAANFADLGATAKVTCTLLMLVGRLEIYTALSLFVPTLWRN